MLGSPAKIFQNLSVSATCCIFDPGSVTAMKRPPTSFSPTAFFTRSKKYCLKMFGSSVLPDLLETMHSVFLRSSFFSIALICAGSVESRTCSSGNPATLPKVMSSTSGHKLEPPIPSNRTCLNFAFFTSDASCCSVPRFASCSYVMVNQPSHLFSLVLLQSEASFCHSRATLLFFFQSSSEAATAACSSLGSL